ncbi:unnamed protein product [Echinostoma caproni]|uniref:FBO_C domain-containing protein n=1 Tax=Echinostoma caproni TaxID=27848 RepID=A0A183AM55_9TREM|nr:unnamed protein product [Echinostoma caproni]
MGEPTFTDYYRPVHLVVYYRGIRFHTDGRVEMLTSSSDPSDVVSALGRAKKSGTPIDGEDCTSGLTDSESNSPNLLQGRYVWEEPNMITCVLKRPAIREKTQTYRRFRYHQKSVTVPPDVTFTIRFRLTSSKRRLHNVLNWESYVIDTANRTIMIMALSQMVPQRYICATFNGSHHRHDPHDAHHQLTFSIVLDDVQQP